jgi:hypothetical protein
MLSAYQHRPAAGVNHFSPTWFPWTFIMAYSKVEMKSSGNEASPCYRPFWIENIRQMLTYTDFAVGFI